MKNIVISLLAIVCVLLCVYAFVQKTAATKAQIEATQNLLLAETNAELGRQQKVMAEEAMKRAHEQQLIAEQNLLECMKRKK